MEKLKIRGFISDEIETRLLKIWKDRDDYHHLNSSIENDHQKLEIMAKEKLELLNQVESEIFDVTIEDEKIIPKQLKYWDFKGNQIEVYLRCL